MATQDAIVVKLGLTPEQLMGYAYAGLLAAFVAAVVEPTETQQLISVLSGFLAAIVALALGIGIYVLYFKILGEFLLYPLQHFVHRVFDGARGKSGVQHTSCVRYLGALGVPVGQRRVAYERVKGLFFQERDRRRIQVAHGELHVLYLTAVECCAAGIYLQAHQRVAMAWFIAAAVIYLAALIADVHQHSIESYMLRTSSAKDVHEFLVKAGFI